MSQPYWADEARDASRRRFLGNYSQEAVAGRLESALRSVVSTGWTIPYKMADRP